MEPFSELTHQDQILHLSQIALLALEQYDIQVAHLRPIDHSFNAIFQLDTPDGRRFALRVNEPGRDLVDIRSEMWWLAALTRETSLIVPTPLAARNGEYAVMVEIPGVPQARHVSVFEWIYGIKFRRRRSASIIFKLRKLMKKLVPAHRLALFDWIYGRKLRRHQPEFPVFKLGQLMAKLHNHADTIKPPKDFTQLRYPSPWRHGRPMIIYSKKKDAAFIPKQRAILQEVALRVEAATQKLEANPQNLRYLHGDLHLWNVIMQNGELAALDFDSSHWGYYVQDIGKALRYQQDFPNYSELCRAFEQGYSKLRPWPEEYPGQIDTFVAGSSLDYISFLVKMDSPEKRDRLSIYLASIEKDLEAFLDSQPI